MGASQFTHLSHHCHESIQPCRKHGHRVLSGWSTTLSNSAQTLLMNVSHFILGIRFCTANGHNYVAKLKGAINKTEPSTEPCRKQWAESLTIAGLWKKQALSGESGETKDGEISAWTLHARTVSRSSGKSNCDSHRTAGHVGTSWATCKACSTLCTTQTRCFLLPSPSRLCHKSLLVMGFCLPHHGGLLGILS